MRKGRKVGKHNEEVGEEKKEDGRVRGRKLRVERVSCERTYALEFPSRGCDDGTGNRNCSTSILDEATIFLRRERKGNINEARRCGDSRTCKEERKRKRRC